MSAASLNQIYEAIGSLKTEVVGMRRDIEESERKAVKAAEDASQSRAVMHRRMDDIAQRAAILETDMNGVKGDMREVKLVTDDVTKWKQAGMGALAVTGIASSALTTIIVSYWEEIVKVFRAG